MTGSRFDAVLFDFDGTLAPNLDLPDMRRQVIERTRAAGVPDDVFSDRFIVEVIDAGREWLDVHNPQTAASYHDECHQLITKIEMDAAAETDVFSGVPELLATLRARDVRTAVVTRNCRAAVLKTFPQADRGVDALLARDDVTHFKPDPRHLTDALGALAANAGKSIMVGDGAMDMQVGREVGMTCVGVLTGSSDKRRLVDAGAHAVLDDVLGLDDWIEQAGLGRG